MSITTLPNPGMDFTPLTTLTAEQMDDIVENIEAINNATIQTNSIANGAVTRAKLAADATSGQNYSTAEINTGTTWTDGKTIYKKTYAKTIASAQSESSYTTALNISNLSAVVKIEGIRKVTMTDSTIEYLPIPYSGLTGDYFGAVIEGTSLAVIWKLAGHANSRMEDKITIYYTK